MSSLIFILHIFLYFRLLTNDEPIPLKCFNLRSLLIGSYKLNLLKYSNQDKLKTYINSSKLSLNKSVTCNDKGLSSAIEISLQRLNMLFDKGTYIVYTLYINIY